MSGPREASPIETEELCSYGCGEQAKYVSVKGVFICSNFSTRCVAVRKKNKDGLKKSYVSGKVDAKKKYQNYTEDAKKRMVWSKGKTIISDERLGRISIDRIFCPNSHASSSYVRKLVKQERLIEYRCSCGLVDTWENDSLSLQLDHIDGDRSNNLLSNLRWLCPNCHSQTPTFAGKNSGKHKKYVSDDELKEAMQNTPSIRQALLRVGLRADSGNYQRAYKLTPW